MWNIKDQWILSDKRIFCLSYNNEKDKFKKHSARFIDTIIFNILMKGDLSIKGLYSSKPEIK